MLHRNPGERIGVKSKEEIKKHEFFNEIDWSQLYERKVEPPLNLVDIKQELAKEYPSVTKEIHFNDRDYQEKNADFNRVKNFTFVRHSPNDNIIERKNPIK